MLPFVLAFYCRLLFHLSGRPMLPGRHGGDATSFDACGFLKRKTIAFFPFFRFSLVF